MNKPRVVIVAHSHPLISSGGGEIAAYRQFQHMALAGYETRFVGLCNVYDLADTRFIHGTQWQLEVSRGDYLVKVDDMMAETLEQQDLAQEDRLVEFLVSLRPDVLHLHHLWKLGASTVRRVRAALPDVELILTAHEYLAICALHGQMLKADGSTLCYAATPVDCARCFPEKSPVDFIIRHSRISSLLALCDRIISPSAFLAGRLAASGVPEDRIEVIDNGLQEVPTFPEEDAAELAAKARRFGFFGNATPTKGLNVLIEAAAVLERQGVRGVTIDVYGASEAKFLELWPGTAIPGNVTFRGRYAPHDAISIMRNVGWMVIPSIWWENSPVIIQEARAARTPMLYSNIGGMAEKAAGAGLPFRVGDAMALAEIMAEVVGDEERLAGIKAEMAPPMDMADYLRAWEAGRNSNELREGA